MGVPFSAWAIRSKDRLVAIIYYESSLSHDEVRNHLIKHEGFNKNIVIEKLPGVRTPGVRTL